MELSMYTCYALGKGFSTPVEAFRHFYEKGVRFGDMVDDEFTRIPFHLYCDSLIDGGIVPEAVVTMLDTASFSASDRERNISAVKGYIDQMEKRKVPILMLAPSVRPAGNEDELMRMQSLLIEGFSDVIEYSKGSGITVTIENQSTLQRADSRMEDIRYILDCVPELGFVLDTGNFFCVGEDVLKAYELLKDRMMHMHCKDWTFNPYGHFVRENMPRFEGVAVGEGKIPIKELFSLLRKDGYGGNAVLEINASPVTLDMLDRSADFLRNEINSER